MDVPRKEDVQSASEVPAIRLLDVAFAQITLLEQPAMNVHEDGLDPPAAQRFLTRKLLQLSQAEQHWVLSGLSSLWLLALSLWPLSPFCCTEDSSTRAST